LAGDSWEAYQIDLATLELGTHIENKLAERDKQGKAKHSLAELLADKPEEAAKLSFASLGGMVTRKIAIPESGVWE
jgi:uncharacterized protein YigE (DUF2233 family)